MRNCLQEGKQEKARNSKPDTSEKKKNQGNVRFELTEIRKEIEVAIQFVNKY